MKHLMRNVLVLGVLAHPMQVFGEEAAAGVEKAPNKLALSVSALRAPVASMGELGVEYNFNNKMSAAVTLGLGPADVDTRDSDGNFSSESVLCFSSGAQFRYFLYGNFDRGAFGGAELAYIRLSRDAENSARPKHEGLWAGPTVGYKHTFDFGMMLSAAFTVGLPLVQPDGLSDDEIPGDLEEGSEPVVGGVLLWPNVSVGWAF